MGPLPSAKPAYSDAERALLVELARASIRHGLKTGTPLRPEAGAFSARLKEMKASFVTLELDGHLRGCIGSLTPRRPLADDVAENAFAAAFRDPRFRPVDPGEIDRLEIHLSVLGTPEPMHFTSEADLLAQIRPGIDGLVLEDRGYRGTFLPSV